jgi:hypothetical protein
MSELRILGREAFLAAKLRTEEVECPELGGAVLLRELTIGQLKQLNPNDPTQHLALMIVDEGGSRIFHSEADVRQLGTVLSAAVAKRLMTAAAKLNGIDQASIDEAVKNSAASLNGDSASA